MIQRLYQEHPAASTSWQNVRSYTSSRASYDKAAKREAVALLINGTIPNYLITLSYHIVMSVARIKNLWSKHSRRLRRAGVVGRVAIEITKDKWRKHPVNRVHYHIVVKYSETLAELKQLVCRVCCREMDKRSFSVKGKEINNWYGFVWYFVKYRNWNNYLFQPNLGLQKFYSIGKWWTNKDGTERTRASINGEIKAFAIKRAEEECIRKEFEQAIQIYLAAREQQRPIEQSQYNRIAWRGESPTNHAKLKALLDRKRDETLYDWYSILLDKPTGFKTDPPRWFDDMKFYPRKCVDLLTAIYERIRYSNNPYVLLGLEIYHGL